MSFAALRRLDNRPIGSIKLRLALWGWVAPKEWRYNGRYIGFIERLQWNRSILLWRRIFDVFFTSCWELAKFQRLNRVNSHRNWYGTMPRVAAFTPDALSCIAAAAPCVSATHRIRCECTLTLRSHRFQCCAAPCVALRWIPVRTQSWRACVQQIPRRFYSYGFRRTPSVLSSHHHPVMSPKTDDTQYTNRNRRSVCQWLRLSVDMA